MYPAQLSAFTNPGSVAASDALSGLASAGLSLGQALAAINRLIEQQAYMLAANDVFDASALIFLLLIPLVYLTRPMRRGADGADAAGGGH